MHVKSGGNCLPPRGKSALRVHAFRVCSIRPYSHDSPSTTTPRTCTLPTEPKRLTYTRCTRAQVEPTKQILLYSRPEAHKNDIPEVLDDDLKRLCDFGVVSGGTIIVEEATDE